MQDLFGMQIALLLVKQVFQVGKLYMGINDASNLGVKTLQVSGFANLRSIPPSVFQDKLVNSLGSDSFKSVLSDSKEADSVKAKVQTASQSNVEKRPVSQSNAEKREVKKSENDVAEGDNKRTEKVLSSPSLKFLPGSSSALQEILSQSNAIESDGFLSAVDMTNASLIKEASEFDNPFGFSQDASQQFPLDDSMVRPVGFSESMAVQNTVAQLNHEKRQSVEQENSLVSEGAGKIDIAPDRISTDSTIVNIRADQRIDTAVLKSMTADQQLGASQINVSIMKPMQTIVPLVTPILLSNFDSANEVLFGVDSEGVEIGSVTGKPTSFVEASQHQKQLLNKNGEGGSEDNPEQSFDGSDSQSQQVSANAADSVQRTLAAQKLTQIIRDRAQDAIEKGKNDMALNVKGIQTTLGEVELDLKISNKKISVRISSESKNMQTLLNQERSSIISILNGLIGSTEKSEYVLADIPVEICHKEKGI
ncbi:MAG: hypothetical protein NWS47_00165 [Alphaproteobacteria bacterium]|nr:hypothetical protein [Alphaproteobacteria bacterium]